ncbi:MAG: hypothetical protein HQL70_00450 [Magnetococcales bacterium]|nr:hypothetical protein [Magnetococcales bacterium]
MRIVYAGCNFFASVLDEILSNPEHEVLYCLTDEEKSSGRHISLLSKINRIPIHKGAWSSELITTINYLSADLFISAAYPFMVPVGQLNCKHFINLHPSLLPIGRGPNPLPKLITDSPQASGLTIHTMTQKLDAGPIILQSPIPIDDKDSFDTLAMKMFIEAPKLVGKFLECYPEILNTAQQQQSGIYWPCCPDEARTVNWQMGINEILELHRQYGYTGIIFPFENQLNIEATNIIGIECEHKYPAGELVLDGGKFFYIAVWDGLLRIWL